VPDTSGTGAGAGAGGGAGAGATPKYNDVTDIGVDLPLRIYWFADEHFSFHFESGLSLDIGPEDGNLIGLGAPADGTRWTIFGNLDSNAYGFVGGTFWW